MHNFYVSFVDKNNYEMANTYNNNGYYPHKGEEVNLVGHVMKVINVRHVIQTPIKIIVTLEPL